MLSSHGVKCYHPTHCRFLLSEKTSYHFKNYGAQEATSQWVEQQSFINNNNNNRSKGSKWQQLNSLVVERQEHQNISLQPDRVTDKGETFEGQTRGLSLLPSRRIRKLEENEKVFGHPAHKKDSDEEKMIEAEKYNHKTPFVTKTKSRNNHSDSLFLPIGPKRSGHASLGNFLRDSYQNENIR